MAVECNAEETGQTACIRHDYRRVERPITGELSAGCETIPEQHSREKVIYTSIARSVGAGVMLSDRPGI